MKIKIATEQITREYESARVWDTKHSLLDITEQRAKELIEMLLNDPPNFTGSMLFSNQAICAIVQSDKKLTGAAVEDWKRAQRNIQAKERRQKLEV